MKLGSSTRFAVQRGAYKGIPAVSNRSELELGELEDLLGRIHEGKTKAMSDLSYMVRASLKLDFYDVAKAHGPGDKLGRALFTALASWAHVEAPLLMWLCQPGWTTSGS